MGERVSSSTRPPIQRHCTAAWHSFSPSSVHMHVQIKRQPCVPFSRMPSTSPGLGVQAHDTTSDLFDRGWSSGSHSCRVVGALLTESPYSLLLLYLPPPHVTPEDGLKSLLLSSRISGSRGRPGVKKLSTLYSLGGCFRYGLL